MRVRAVWTKAAALTMALGLAACATGPSGPPAPIERPNTGVNLPETPRQPGVKPGLSPPHLNGRDLVRIGVLLPFSQRPADADGFYNAAELALFDHGQDTTLLMPRDSRNAEDAARSLIRDGADLIVGPINREEVGPAGRAARSARTPVIAFSTDRSVAGDGVYLLSLPLEEEVARVVGYASAQGVQRFALLAPETDYGKRVEQAFRAEVGRRGGNVVVSRFYPRADREAAAAAAAFAPELAASGAQALMLPEGGSTLRAVAPGLVQGGANLSRIRLLGTGAWAGEATREPTLAGGWYAAPEPPARTDFENRYRAAYGRAPSRLSSLAYDAVAVAAALSRDPGRAGLNRSALERSDGFVGADGLFRFRGDGSVERALAVLEVRPGGAVVIEGAPKRFAGPGS
jgi:ABC-type branched-subunit amino acid transport system substrate-binding protein